MLVTVRTLCEKDTFKALLRNATGFSPDSSWDHLQNIQAGYTDTLASLAGPARRQGVIILAGSLFRPFDTPAPKTPPSQTRMDRIRTEQIVQGLGVLRWILRNRIPLILEDTPETREELGMLRAYSPPLYDKLQAERLEMTLPDGSLDTAPLERMGTYNPDKDRDGEQYLYGDLMDHLRDTVGWKDHDLAVRLIGDYAVRGRWNGSGVERPETKDTP